MQFGLEGTRHIGRSLEDGGCIIGKINGGKDAGDRLHKRPPWWIEDQEILLIKTITQTDRMQKTRVDCWVIALQNQKLVP